MQLLYQEVRQTFREMYPTMPGHMQEVVVEARAQLQVEANLKDVCKQLNIPVPLTTLPSVVISEEAPSESEAQTTEKTERTQKEDMTPQATLSTGMPRRITLVR